MSVLSLSARSEDAAPPGADDELSRLRARVAVLERELAPAGDATPRSRTAEFQAVLYEAMLYAMARTLSLYDPASVRVLVREMGRRIREYLEEVGYDLGSPHTIEEAVETTSFFTQHGFCDLEVVNREENIVHVRWRSLLGFRAYARIAAAGGATFISCPLAAVVHDGLAGFGKELALRAKQFDIEQQVLESWEEIVDSGNEVTQLTLDAEQVLRLDREQSRQLRVRDEFIRIASHELSTPLTSTKLALARLERAELVDPAGRSVAVIKRQVRRLEQLVGEMLDTTRLQIGRLTLNRRPANLVEIVRDAMDSLASDSQPETRVTLSGEASLVGPWDAGRLDQVVTNLLTNAIKYGEGRPIEVDVGARQRHAQLRVRDHGIGIPTEMIGRIFEPFERAVPVEKYGGLGLGLYIARRIVEMHGGRITVESVLGEGSTFTVELPMEDPGEANSVVDHAVPQQGPSR